jgi:hypothetical protein
LGIKAKVEESGLVLVIRDRGLTAVQGSMAVAGSTFKNSRFKDGRHSEKNAVSVMRET